MFVEFDLYDMNNDVDLGVFLKECVYVFVEEYLKWGVVICMWYDNWFDFVGFVIDYFWWFLWVLCVKGVLVFVLLNFGDDIWDCVLEVFEILKEFDCYYVLGKLGYVKLFNCIYEIVEEDSVIELDWFLFVDDCVDNIEMVQV